MSMILRIGAAEYSLRVITPAGKSTYDLSKLNTNQLDGVREMVVNYFARERGLREPYQVRS